MYRFTCLARVAPARDYSLARVALAKKSFPSQGGLIANCVQVHVGEKKGKNGAHAFAAVVHLHVCSGWGRCCGAGTQSYLSMTYSRHITVKGECKLSLLPHLMVMFLVFGIGLVAGFALGTWWASPHRQQGRPQTRHEFLMASR